MLGYENEKLEFNYKKSCGLWLIAIAIVIVIATLIGGKQIINMQVFSIGYMICFFSINMNKGLLNKLSTGSSTKFQKNISKYSVILLFVLMAFLGGPFFDTENWRMIWLGALLATALHFFSILFCAWKINDFFRYYVYYQYYYGVYFLKCSFSILCI